MLLVVLGGYGCGMAGYGGIWVVMVLYGYICPALVYYGYIWCSCIYKVRSLYIVCSSPYWFASSTYSFRTLFMMFDWIVRKDRNHPILSEIYRCLKDLSGALVIEDRSYIIL